MTTKLTYPYIAPNRTQAKNIAWDDHVERILDEFNRKGLKYKRNEVELSISIPGRGKLQLMGVENKEALRGISNWGGVFMDEMDDWTEDIWPTIIRPNLMVHKSPAIASGTPKGFKLLHGLSQDPNWKEFHFTSYENPDLDREELEAMVKEYKELGEDYYKQEILAEYVSMVGAVYKEWPMDQRFISVPYDMNLPLYVSFDWGVNDPTAILWIQIRGGGEFRLIDAMEITDANVETIAAVIKSKPYKAPEMYTGDPAGKARQLQTGTSVIEMLANKGIYVKTKDGVTIPEQIRIAKSRIRSLYVDNKLTHVRDCFINYRYPIKKETSINQSNEIPIHDKYSHTMRALEYFFVNYKKENPVTNLPDDTRLFNQGYY